jgi:hypothetical protein
MITNSNHDEVRDLGYTDLIPVGKVKIQFARMGHGSESRTSYFYMRKSFHLLPKNDWTFEFESPELEVGHPFNEVWQIFNEGRLDPGTKQMKENYSTNWKIIEMNLTQDTGVNFVERVDRVTRNTKVNYNETALAKCAFRRIPAAVVVTPLATTFKAKTVKSIDPIQLVDNDDELTSGSFGNVEDVGYEEYIVDSTIMVDSENDDVSTFKTEAPKSIEMTKLFKCNDELTAGLFDDVEDVGSEESIVDLTNLVDSEDDSSDDESLSFESDWFEDLGSEESIVDLTNLVDSEDDLSDDKSLSFESDEFIDKGLWIAGQENPQMTSHNHSYIRFPKTPLGLSGVQVEMCINATEHYYKKYMETIVMKDLQDRIAPGEIGYQEIRQRNAGRYDMQVPTFDKDEFSFLHDLNAPWMPFVRKFLSNSNVAFIHKGIILSTDQSAKQNYHSDGIHLDTKEHQPCYAVNVFFYLIDISVKNGGTEFYMRSHKLRNMFVDKSMVS